MLPAKIRSLLEQALALHRSGQLAAADKLYRQVIAAAPKTFDALHLSGVVALQEGRAADALELLERAHRLDRKSAMCEFRLAVALMETGQLASAEEHFREVVRRSPELAEAWDRLAGCLRLKDQLADAVPCHEKAVALAPQNGALWYNFGLTYSLLGYPERALPCHERALAVDPGSVLARGGRAQALHQLHRLPEAVEEYDRVLEAAPDSRHIRSMRLFALHHIDGVTREKLFAEHVAYGKTLPECSSVVLSNDRTPDRRLRLAILSCDLREHSCAYFLLPLLQHLDPAQFEVHLYHDHFRTDAMSERLRSGAKIWRHFAGLPDASVESAIRADAPDILVDLGGHTGISNRLPLFARRLAPVQITYLGYPNTTGVDAMDYRFTDEVTDPVGDGDAFATERLVRFAPTAWAYSPPVDSPLPVARAEGAPITFGSFNTPAKWTERMTRVWAQVLRSVPGSRLVLKGSGLELDETRARVLEWFGRSGADSNSVVFLPRTRTIPEHLSCYNGVDVALDTFPYHGTTTTCEALWMGVPVVSLIGDRHVSRVGASLLSAVGHPEWIADSEDDYLRIAVELARDAVLHSARRSALREEVQCSPLMDHLGQSRRFAAALRACWVEWCGRQSAAA